MTNEELFILFPPNQAAALKWRIGRAKHGGIFQGDPMQHLYAELLDAMNYTQVIMARPESPGTMPRLWKNLARAAWHIYSIAQERNQCTKSL